MKVLTAMKMSLAVVVFALAGAAAADTEKFPGYCKRVGICWTGSEFLFTSP